MQCGSADLRVCAGHAGKSIHFRKNTLECLGNSHLMGNMPVTRSQKVLKRLMILNVDNDTEQLEFSSVAIRRAK